MGNARRHRNVPRRRRLEGNAPHADAPPSTQSGILGTSEVFRAKIDYLADVVPRDFGPVDGKARGCSGDRLAQTVMSEVPGAPIRATPARYRRVTRWRSRSGRDPSRGSAAMGLVADLGIDLPLGLEPILELVAWPEAAGERKGVRELGNSPLTRIGLGLGERRCRRATLHSPLGVVACRFHGSLQDYALADSCAAQ